MKKLSMKLKLAIMATLGLITILSCSDEPTINNIESNFTITAHIESQVDNNGNTRTSVDENSTGATGIYWSPRDTMGVYDIHGLSSNIPFISSNIENKGKAEFSGYITGTPAFAYYPYSRLNDGKSYTAVVGEIPNTQLYSSEEKRLYYDYKIGIPTNTEGTEFNFTHLFTMLNITVDATNTVMYDEKLEKVSLVFNQSAALCGKFNLDLSQQAVSWTEQPSDKHILNLVWTNQPELTNNVVKGYLNCAPANVKDQEVTVIVQTTDHIATFKAGLQSNFKANTVYTFPLNLSYWSTKAGADWTLSGSPTIESFEFKAAQNSGKILENKVYYNASASKTVCSTDELHTTQSLTIEGNEISGCIPYLTDYNLVPTINCTEGSTLEVKLNGVYNEYVAGTSIDFTNPVVFRLTNGLFNNEYVVSVRNSGLPVMVINQQGGSTTWNETGLSIYPKDADFDNILASAGGSITVYNADGTVNLNSAAAAVRLRGNTTQDYPKKPFAIKLDKKADILNIMNGGTHKRWVLLANWKDRSLMRNAVSMGLAEVMKNTLTDGMKWNPTGKHVELIYNGVHIGNYFLTEQIKIDKGRLNIKAPYDITKNGVITADNIDDYGYLLEADDYYDEDAKFTTRTYQPFMFKDDVDAGGVIMNYVKNKVQGIEDNLYNGKYSIAYNDLDLNSVIDYWIFYELVLNKELGHPKSVYMYIDGKGKLSAGPVWDFDWQSLPHIDNLTSGAMFESGFTPSYTESMVAYAKAFIKNSGIPNAPLQEEDRAYMWYPLLFKDTETFGPLAKERWETVKGAWIAYAPKIIEMGESLKASAKCNDEMWPVNASNRSTYIGSNAGYAGDENMSFEDAYKAMSENLLRRIEGMSFISNQTYPSISYNNK